MKTDYGYYPGCSLTVSNRAYDGSTRAVAALLGLSLKELDDWNCCGATAYMSVRELSAFVVSSRNLALAQAQGHDELVVVCSACYTTLNKANRYMAENPALRAKITEALAQANLRYDGTVWARHFLDVLVSDVGLEAVQAKVVRPLKSLKVAPYYGCQLVRPHGTFDDPEMPTSLDRLLQKLGAIAVPYPVKARCCGGMLMSTSPEVAQGLVRVLLDVALEMEADCIATVCPLCQVNLEAYQGEVNRRFGTHHRIPVLYFTQLMGLALGATPRELGLGRELVPAQGLLARIGL